MSAYHRVVSAFRGGETGVPSAADLKVIAEESSIENFVEDLDVLLPRLLQISVTSEDLELRTQIFKCFANLKNALLLRKSVASEKWWRDLETYMPNDFMTDLKKLIDRNDPSWKESWSLVLFLCFNNPSKKGKCLNSVLKTAEYAFKSKNQRAIDTVFEGWLELIEMFASNHTIMDITRIVSLLIKPLISAQLNPTDRLLKVKSWDVIFHQFGPLSVTSNPSSFQSILIPMISNMFLKGNNSLAASYPNECFKIIINLFEKDFPIHDFIAQVIIAIPTFLDFVIDHDSLLKILNRILDSVSSMDENIKAQLTTNMTKFSEKAIESKFVFNEETIGKLTFLPDIMVEKLSENIVTKLSPVQNKIDQNSEVSNKNGPAELIVESPKTTWTNPLASKSVFMHRLAKAESEKKAKSTCSSIHDLITSSPKTSKIENAPQVTPKKEVEKLVSNLTPKSKVVADPKTNSSNGGTLSEIQNISSSPQVTAKTPVVSESKIDANSSFKSESEKNSSITPKLVTPSKIQKISASPQMTPKTPIEKKSPKIQAGVANLTPKSKTPTKCTYFEDDNASDYVVIKPKEKITVLTEHQKEILSQRKSDIPALYQDLSQDTQSIVKEVDHLVTHTVSEEDQRWLLQDENNENVKNTVDQEVPEVASEDKIHQPEENEKMDVDDKIETVNKSGDSMEVNMEKNRTKEPKNGIASVDKCLKPQVNDEKREDDTYKKTESDSNEDKKARKITRSSIPKPTTSNKRKSTKKPINDDSKLKEVVSEDQEEDKIPKQESNKRKSTKKLEESLCDDKKTPKSEAPKETNVDDPKLEESEETPNKRAKKSDGVDSSEELTSKQDETSKQEISNKRKSTKDSKLEEVASEDKEEKISKAETDKRKSTKTDEDPKNDAEGKPKRITRHSLSTQVQENTKNIKISADKKETGENNSSPESISSPKKEKEIEKNDDNSESKVQNDTEDENVGTPVHEIKRGRGRPRKSASTTDSKDGSESGKDEKTRRRGRSKSTANETMKPDEEKPEKDHSVDSNDLSDSKDGSELGKDQKTVGRGRRKSRAKETMKLNEDNTEKDQSVDSNDGTDSKDGSELGKDENTGGRGRRKSTAKETMKANEEKPGKDQPVDSDDGKDSKDGSELGKDENTGGRGRRKSTAKETMKPNEDNTEKDQSVDSNGSSSKAETNSSEKTSDSDSNEETSSIEAKDKLTKKTQDEESTKNEKSRKRRKSAPVKLESKTKNSGSPKVEGRVRRKSASVAYSKIVTKKTSQPNEDKSPDSDKKEPKKSPDNSSEEQNKRNSCSNLSDTPVKAPLEPKALTEPRKRAKKQPESLKRVKKVSNLTSQSGSDGISTSQDEFISSSESTYEPSMDDVECPEDSDLPNATSEDEAVDVMYVDSVQNSDSTESAENGRTEPDSVMEENEQVDESVENAVVEETVKTPADSKKRKRDETDTPMQNEVKKPCLAATPGAKPKKKIMEDITKFFPRIDVPKSFSFGSTSLKEEKNPEVSPKTPKSLKEEKIENEVENKQNAKPFRIKEERNEEAEVSVENKDNTEPNGHINFIKKEKDDNEKSIEDKENTEPINETSALSEVSSDSVLSVKAEHEGSESPILPTSSSSSSGMSTPLIFREKRRSIIPEKFGDNWPCGAQKKWVASVPSPGITPTKSNLKNISSVQTETPPNMKKRVSFVNPVVTKGLLYDDRSNSGKLHLQDEQESETSMETDVDTSADDSHMDAQSSVDAVPKSPIVNALSDGSLVAVLVPKSPAVTPIISETPPASDTVQKSPVVVAPPVNSSEPMSVDAVEEITGEPSELADAPRRCDSSTQTDTIPISQLLSKNELVSIFNEFVKSCQIQLVMKD